MLQHLFIKDLAIVSQVDISFSSGMTVITGETGAGKSILLDALNLALGERSESHLVRPGAEKAEIAATFDIAKLPSAILWLNELELTCDSPHHCMIRRILYTNGRSKAFINGRPATTQQLRLLGEYLLQIHGQHQHQLLLKSHEQLRLLDAFGQHDANLSQIKSLFKSWEKLKAQIAHLKEGSIEQARMDLLEYQIAEIESLQLSENELNALHEEHDKLSHAQSYIQSCEQVLAILENQEEANALQLIQHAQNTLRPMLNKIKALAGVNECLENAAIQLQESITEINHFIQQLEIDPERLSIVEQRLERIHDMARKHKVDPTLLRVHFSQLQEKARQFTDMKTKLKALEQDIVLIQSQYQSVAKQLSKARSMSAQKLAFEVTQRIQTLGMNDAVFTVDLVPLSTEELHYQGNESITFGISANPGHPPQPLNKVASGGELSRISLALELITAQYLATPALVFDEVDVGISGKIGAIVGKALSDLSQSAQVICITHLPQVASFGDHHIQVSKTKRENTTISEIHVLDQKQRVNEIARMLGGMDVTAQARAHAKKLLEKID